MISSFTGMMMEAWAGWLLNIWIWPVMPNDPLMPTLILPNRPRSASKPPVAPILTSIPIATVPVAESSPFRALTPILKVKEGVIL